MSKQEHSERCKAGICCILPAGWWVLICAACGCAGWALSALHQLNARAYVLLGAVAVIGGAVLLRGKVSGYGVAGSQKRRGQWFKQLRRFRRGLPLRFAILAGLAILGGVLHAPTNYDGLSYRTPRVLHWLAGGQWHWIHTQFQRLNTRAAAFEWITAPILAVLRTDRLLFLINAASFLLLPGLIFGTFRRLGVRDKVAWHWMWILPTGYCYLVQAGSIGNDLFGALFPLAAIFFALRAAESEKPWDAWLSVLAAAVMTASKTSNLPLLLPWAVAMLPAVRLVMSRVGGTIAIVLLAGACSFLPSAALNTAHHAGWSGFKAEIPGLKSGLGWRTVLRLSWNAVLLPVQNLQPPINPMAQVCNERVTRMIPAGLRATLEEDFEPSQAHANLDELPVEEATGLGFGVTALLLAGLVLGRGKRPEKVRNENADSRKNSPNRRLHGWAIIVCSWLSLAVFMAETRWATAARLVTPYYSLVIPLLLLPKSQENALRSRWWKMFAAAVFLIAGLVVVVSPARPLWPAQTVLEKLEERRPGNGLIARAQSVYSTYARRSDAFAPALAALPAGADVLGLVTFDDPETSLWRPFHTRRIEHVVAGDSLEDLKRRGIKYVLVSPEKYEALFNRSFKDWQIAMKGEVMKTIPLQLRAREKKIDWLLVRVGEP